MPSLRSLPVPRPGSRPLVRPRVLLHDGCGEPRLLTEVLGTLLDAGAGGLVHLGGTRGSGKSTALELVARHGWPGAAPTIVDEPDDDELLARMRARPDALLVYARTSPADLPHAALMELAPWSPDDLLEYALALDGSVRERLCACAAGEHAGAFAALEGSPALWALVGAGFERDPREVAPVSAARAELRRRVAGSDAGTAVARACLLGLRDGAADGERELRRVEVDLDDADRALASVARTALARACLGGDAALAELAAGRGAYLLASGLSEDLYEVLSERSEALLLYRETLLALLDDERVDASAPASLLSLATPAWLGAKLRESSRARTQFPDLDRARMPGVVVCDTPALGLRLRHADLRHSRWRRCDLTDTEFTGAKLARARFDRAELEGILAQRTDLTGASLRGCRGLKASFAQARMTGADLRGARLVHADLREVDLTAARLTATNLRGAALHDACLERADLDEANLVAVRASRARFLEASLNAMNGRRAQLPNADLTRARGIGIDLVEAVLVDATLTGSSLPKARMEQADLRGARLAHVSWPGADLRQADLTGATFHFGSTRCGTLQGYPSQGTRTGYYVDDLVRAHELPPEELRVADLRYVDLRGAHTEETDWYLVDLRGVRCSDAQRRHFAGCGAFL